MKVRLSTAAIAAAALVSTGFRVSTASAATPLSDNFEDGNTAGWPKSGGEPVGAVVQRNNFLVGSGTPIPYSCRLDPASSVKSIVMAGVGRR